MPFTDCSSLCSPLDERYPPFGAIGWRVTTSNPVSSDLDDMGVAIALDWQLR